MPRSVPEWVGRTDDTPVPPRVRLRVLERFGRRCDPTHGCGRPLPGTLHRQFAGIISAIVPVLRILIDLLRHLRRWVMRLSPGCSGRGSSFPSRAAEEYGVGGILRMSPTVRARPDERQ